MKSKKSVIKIAKWKMVLYVVGSIAGFASSAILLFLACSFGEGPLINYFLGFSSSLIVTVLFALLLELISLQEQNDKRKRQRNMYLLPVKEYITKLIGMSTCCDLPTGVKRHYTYDDFPTLLKRCFEAYCDTMVKIATGDRTCKTINEAYRYKNGIQKYSIEPLMSSINSIVDNRYYLMANDIFTKTEIWYLENLRDSADYLKLPYMEETKKNRNSAVLEIDYPEEPVNDIVKNNYDSAIKRFMVDLETVTNAFDELKSFKSIKFES